VIKVYGLKNCDTCKKALTALDGWGVAHDFTDVKTRYASAEPAQALVDAVGADTAINRRGTTWRKLSETDKARADSDPAGLMVDHPSLIKRPVFEFEDGSLLVGFAAKDQDAIKEKIGA